MLIVVIPRASRRIHLRETVGLLLAVHNESLKPRVDIGCTVNIDAI